MYLRVYGIESVLCAKLHPEMQRMGRVDPFAASAPVQVRFASDPGLVRDGRIDLKSEVKPASSRNRCSPTVYFLLGLPVTGPVDHVSLATV